MSHIKPPRPEEKTKFNFTQNIDREKSKIARDIGIYNYPFCIDRYDYCEKLVDTLEYNIKGLLENIVYLEMLIKKGLFYDISLDLYREHIKKQLIHNYKFQFIREFCLVNEFLKFNTNTFTYKKYTDINKFYSEGIEFMVKMYRYLKYCEKSYEIDNYNNNSKIKLEGDNFNDIIQNNRNTFYEALEDNLSFSFDNVYGVSKWKVKKICKKIIKVESETYTKNIKMSDINSITIHLREGLRYPDPLGFDKSEIDRIRERRHNLFNDYTLEYEKNKTNRIDIFKLLEFVEFPDKRYTLRNIRLD